MNDFLQTVATLREPGNLLAGSNPVFVARAPGRLDVMGGNVDYTGGLVLEATIREATWAAAQLRTDDRILLVNPQMETSGWQSRVEVSLDQVATVQGTKSLVNCDPAVRWTAYVLGVFHLLVTRWPSLANRGITLYLDSQVPLNKGVSSSAAVEVATMKAATAAYGIPLLGIELAEACQWVENVIADSACGIMDQATSVLGTEGHMLPLLCQPCKLHPLVKLPAGLALWGIDSGVKHAVSGMEYEAARAAAFIGYRMICDWEGLPVQFDPSGGIPRYTDSRWNGYLSMVPVSVFRSLYEPRLPELLTGPEVLASGAPHYDPFTQIRPQARYHVRACTKYAIEEQNRIELFVELLGNLGPEPSDSACRLLGDLMLQSHWSYSECGLGSAATDRIIELVRQQMGPGRLYGAKITGGGAGGTVVVLGDASAEPCFRSVVEEYGDETGSAPYVFTGSSIGADAFGIRVLGGRS